MTRTLARGSSGGFPAPLNTGRNSMTARDTMTDLVTVAADKAPRLAADVAQPYDVRLEDLLQGQQGILDLVLSGASLQEVVTRVVAVVEAAFAPATAVVSLFQRGGRVVKCQAASNLPAEILGTVGAFVDDYQLDPTATSVLSGERIVVGDFPSVKRWTEHATLTVAP